MEHQLPLLLAPAGSPAALIAACAAGADAVYLGGRQFGARQFASNFSDEQLEEAVRYAHLRGIQVYVTVNTLITESEIPPVLNYLLFLFRIGVDAVLIQDIGLLSLARKNIPELTLHASTQMGIHNIPGARYAADHGCSRIVLARELSGDEIQDIAQALSDFSVDLEVFAHGALCYAYSGRCLLSSLVGGRSGNRGMCAQPCRKQYQILEGDTDQWGRLDTLKSVGNSGYLLSTKDLSTYSVLDKIVTYPVAALKIEGRMRSPEYVATVVSIYRKALDDIQNGFFHPDSEDIGDLSIAFSRGFTTGYLCGSSFFTVMGREYPGNQGYYLGEVISCGRGRVQVRLSSDILPHQGDGLVIRDRGREEGFVLRDTPVINNGIIELPSPFQVKPGAQVFLTKRKKLDKRISHLLANPDERYFDSLDVSCSVWITSDGKITGTGEVRDRSSRLHPFAYSSAEILEPAKTHSLTKEQFRKQLGKTGGTMSSFSSISISGEEGWFASFRVLNNLRREILLAAEASIVQSYIPDSGFVTQAQVRIRENIDSAGYDHSDRIISNAGLVVICASVSEARAALEHGADQVYLLWNPTFKDVSSLLQYAERLGIMIPGIIRQYEINACIEDLENAFSAGIPRILVDSVGIGEYVREKNPGTLVSAYYGLPIANSASMRACEEFEFITLSPELSEHEIQDICKNHPKGSYPDLAVCCQGLIEAAVTEDHLCSLPPDGKSRTHVIRDEKKYQFPFYCEESGRTHILNSSEHCLIDEYPDLLKSGIRWCIVDARFRGKQYAGEMTGLWKKILQIGISGEDISPIRERIVEMSYGGITRSGYRRGLSAGN